MSAPFVWPIFQLRCGICERLRDTTEFTDSRDRSICAECWRDHDEMVAETEGRCDA